MVVFREWPNLVVGDVITCQTHTKSDGEVHSKLIELWQPRWKKLQAVDPSILERASNFVGNFVPQNYFEVSDIQPAEWYRAVSRLKPTAARGPDGFAKLDLLRMPLFYVQILLNFLIDIELGRRVWPRQMLEGFVLALAKFPGAHSAEAYRPIVLFSMVYRVWASLRCRQLLHQLEQFAHSDAHGFMPGRETAQSWLTIQATVELAVQSGQCLAGMATDLKKAFNNIQRPQWFCLGDRIGLPARILAPWKAFLNGFTRRFQVHGNLSDALDSNVGFAEGDPLSVLAMAALDWCLRIYQDALAPPLRTLTFVDNISLMTPDLGHLALGFFTLQAFLELWGLETDLAKSYAWCTSAKHRHLLQQLGISIVSDAAELGGSLTLGAARRVRIFLQRGEKMSARWDRLRLSRAPLAQKQACLPISFWSAALHGSLGCVFSDKHLHDLRKQAMKHLRVRSGGMNALLRLSLATPTTCDPGFYNFKTCLFDFRRLVGKCPELLSMWRIFMRHYNGKPSCGPFYKILDLCTSVGWSFTEVPLFLDHDGCQHDLLQLSRHALEDLILDAWFQQMSHQVRHRHTMRDLIGIDIDLAFFDRKQLTPGDLGKQLALQSGAFVTKAQQSKFDNTKNQLCDHCHVPATLRHWFDCPAMAEHRICSTFSWIDEIPVCQLHHLLVPRSEHFGEFKRYFLNLEDQSQVFISVPSSGIQHLFCDGSFFSQCPKITSTAAWAVVNASTGLYTGFGVVPGLAQSISRAELWGAIAAISWCLHFGVAVTLWSDSMNTVRGITAILEGRWTKFDSAIEDHDLWQKIRALLDEMPRGLFHINWIPAHLHGDRCDPGFEEWVAVWNDVADSGAVSANQNRDRWFQRHSSLLQSRHLEALSQLRRLRTFFFKIADTRLDPEGPIDLTHDDSALIDSAEDHLSLSDALAIDWKVQLHSFQQDLKYPVQFAYHLFEAVCLIETTPQIICSISFLEMTLWLLLDVQIPVPIWDPVAKCWVLRDYFSLLLRPTVSSVVSHVKQTFLQCLKGMGFLHFYQKNLSRLDAGIIMPVDGLHLSTDFTLSSRLGALAREFGGSHGLRKASDIAKPL